MELNLLSQRMRHSNVQHAFKNIKVGLIEGLTLEADLVAINSSNESASLMNLTLLDNAKQCAAQDGIRHPAHFLWPQLQLQLPGRRRHLLDFCLLALH
jgi:hypothetical protein